MRPKNILFVVTDDQRCDTIAALGNPDIRTPTLDALVREGTAFTQAHIPGGSCGAVCMPSRAMLFSSRTLFHLQGDGENIPPEHVTLPELLRQNGWECFGTGKWHNGTPAFARSFTCGDNIFFGGMWDHWNVPTCRYDPTGEYDNVINFVANFWYSNEPWKIHCDEFHPGVHSSELLTESALRFLRGRRGDRPFFLSLTYLAPHDPRTMPERFARMYDPAALTLPPNCLPRHPFDYGIETIRDECLAGRPRTEAEIRRHLADYYGMISHLDEQLGRILALLREQGAYDDTLIVFTGDNGLALGSHGLMGKQSCYEHSVRVPLLLAGPGVPAGRTSGAYVYLLDLLPTLCELLGLPVPESAEGRSFAPAFSDPDFAGRDTLYFAYGGLVRAVKDRRFKRIDYCGQTRRTQLFDLQNDPFERFDLAGDPARAPQLEALGRLLREYRAAWEDTGHPQSAEFWSAF